MAYAYGDEGYDERPRRRRGGRRFLIVLLVLVLVLGGLLALADRLATAAAERAIGDQVRQQLAAENVQSSPPDVTVGGFPFLTQVLDENYKSISIALRDLTGEGLRLPRVQVEANDVAASMDTITSGQGDIVARTVQGTATIDYPSLVQLVQERTNVQGLQLANRDGRLAVTMPVELLGEKFTLSGLANLTASQGKIRMRIDELVAAEVGALPGINQLLSEYAKRISLDVPLPALPFALVVQGVRAQADGLAVTAVAKNVPLNKQA